MTWFHPKWSRKEPHDRIVLAAVEKTKSRSAEDWESRTDFSDRPNGSPLPVRREPI
jgi:hypothetical protein